MNNSIERELNLKYIIDFYHKNIKDSNIIVVEQDTKTDLKEFNYIKHVQFTCNDSFNRSLCLNIGYVNSSSEYLLLIDNDIILEKKFLNNIDNYTNNNVILIPYNKKLFRLNKQQTYKILNDKKINIENINKHKLSKVSILSVGGAMLINKNTYFNCGGLDINYKGYGFEDFDFYYRCNKKYKINRYNGNFYHLFHISEAYKEENKYTLELNKIYYLKIKKYNNEQLINHTNKLKKILLVINDIYKVK